MLQNWITNLVVSFVLRQLAKFQAAINWATVRADAEQRVKDLVPGTWFDSEAVLVVDYILTAVQLALADKEDEAALLQACATEDWAGALAALQAMVAKVWHPTEAKAQAVAANVAALKFAA